MNCIRCGLDLVEPCASQPKPDDESKPRKSSNGYVPKYGPVPRHNFVPVKKAAPLLGDLPDIFDIVTYRKD